ncbi:TolB family protein [Nocardioides rubriscoriae]|uniref:TolB family protein n=1 Tax=Nocardioides rubriscoriae TaxID=642762 RepID=UPI0011DF8BE5|nr:PD40 domain-containing protein [Nocardioides rubriscoriae]
MTLPPPYRAHRCALVVLVLVVAGLTGLAGPGVTTAADARQGRRPAAPTVTPGHPLVGEPVRVSGRLPTRVRRPVRLERRTGGRWRRVASGRSTRSGAVSFTVAAADGPVRLVAPATRGRVPLRRYVSRSRAVVTAAPRSAPVYLTPSGMLPASGGLDPALSSDGDWVAWTSPSEPIANVDTNGTTDVYLTDRRTGATTLVSRSLTAAAGDQASGRGDVSEGGRYVVFQSTATDLVPGPAGSATQVYRFDRSTGAVVRVSATPAGAPGNGSSVDVAISDDGRWVVFTSAATDLGGDSDADDDVYLWDASTRRSRLVSVTPGGLDGNGPSMLPAVSRDGRFVSFSSDASDLVSGDTNAQTDVFVRDVTGRKTVLVSHAPGGGPADGPSYTSSVSDDGTRVAFDSRATDLTRGGAPTRYDVFLWTRGARAVRLLTPRIGSGDDLDAYEPSLSGDGRWVAFPSDSTRLVRGDTNGVTDVFVASTANGFLARVSVSATGREVHQGGGSNAAGVSRDGRRVVFASSSVDVVPGDTAGNTDVFVTDVRARRAG